MPDLRVFCPPAAAEPAGFLTLSAAESRHLVAAHRARAGYPVTAFDGEGREWDCRLEAAERGAARLRILAARRAPPRACRITLGQALPQGGMMDAIVRKATELGAARIVPLTTARAQVRLDEERSERKRGQWRTAALEAAKQCGNPWLPEIAPVQNLAAFLAAQAGDDLKLMASLGRGAQPLRSVFARAGAPASAAWLIGPEGDFSPEEAELAERAGFVPVSFGPLVLRCETAAICALGLLNHELQAGAELP